MPPPCLHRHNSPRDMERHALRLQRAEHALEQERAMCSHLRRQLEALTVAGSHHVSPAAVATTPQGSREGYRRDVTALAMDHCDGSSSSGPGDSQGLGSASLSFTMLTETEDLRQELAVAQTLLLQRTVEAERLRRLASEREGAAARLRQQLEGLMQGGRRTLDEEQELARQVEELGKVWGGGWVGFR